MSDKTLSRRGFASAALSAATLKGANDRIQIGLIGAGGRGTFNLGEIEKCQDLNAVVTAVCDVYRPNRERAAARVEKSSGARPKEFVDYRELLVSREVDAVIICAPDSAHSTMLEDAVKAGKDVYCEKPMGVEFAEAKAAYLAVKASDRVVQIGTQRRSEGAYIAAARRVQSGALGRITRVDMSVNFQEPRWRRDFTQVRREDVAWDEFLFNRPKRAYDPRRLREWQLFRDYTNGIAGLWMCHFIDLVHWFLEDPYPAGAVANGGVYLWQDGRETSDVFHALLDYPKGFLVSFAMSLTNAAGDRNLWHGTRGTLDCNRWTITGEGARGPDRIEETRQIEPAPSASHMRNFLECVRSRRAPNADIQSGFSHAVAGCMAAQALETGRKMRFDRARLEMV